MIISNLISSKKKTERKKSTYPVPELHLVLIYLYKQFLGGELRARCRNTEFVE